MKDWLYESKLGQMNGTKIKIACLIAYTLAIGPFAIINISTFILQFYRANWINWVGLICGIIVWIYIVANGIQLRKEYRENNQEIMDHLKSKVEEEK